MGLTQCIRLPVTEFLYPLSRSRLRDSFLIIILVYTQIYHNPTSPIMFLYFLIGNKGTLTGYIDIVSSKRNF